mmetsp:Transcript_4791/g.10435  ORF Transcript_4791/g.10435 Transcript_4791/m.10435 type:complete len:96 (-) Transcript_4791:1084-1371(-)
MLRRGEPQRVLLHRQECAPPCPKLLWISHLGRPVHPFLLIGSLVSSKGQWLCSESRCCRFVQIRTALRAAVWMMDSTQTEPELFPKSPGGRTLFQ